MRRSLAPMIVLTVVGLLFGGIFRYFLDDASEASIANYLRSSLHGVGLTLAGWAVHLYFTSHSSGWVRRWPLAVELIVRAMVMAIVVATLAIGLEVVLYDHRIEARWIVSTFPKIMGVTFIFSFLIAVVHELTRLIGIRVLFNVLIGRYRRAIREERVLLFLDLVGSTTLAEQMGELRVQELLTRFFYDIDGAITAHGGEVHAYVGDEVIVTWRVNPRQAAASLSRLLLRRPRPDCRTGRPISAGIRPGAGFPRCPAYRSRGDQRMRGFPPAGRLFWRHRERHRTAAGALQGSGPRPACFRRPVAPA